MESLKSALWALVFVFAIQAMFQTCVGMETIRNTARIADQIPTNVLSRKDLDELSYQLQRIADNLGRCGK